MGFYSSGFGYPNTDYVVGGAPNSDGWFAVATEAPGKPPKILGVGLSPILVGELDN